MTAVMVTTTITTTAVVTVFITTIIIPPPITSFQIFPCYKPIEKYKVEESEWAPQNKEHTSPKLWQIHVYLPGITAKDKEKVKADILELTTLVVHGEAKYHSHCSSWNEVVHSCSCTLVVPMPFKISFKIPPKSKVEKASAIFESEVLVIRIPRE
ncbi:hypothetical protein BB558_003791 [Smittium angustum]|uniref:SHSP domain-containing protein n=1 Tax=Smittium angustum TaxID=133377 RepID=A0A2U1J5C6_SMIAN|nr:hypothetical protein BB558_003791 [Smittium angustum]